MHVDASFSCPSTTWHCLPFAVHPILLACISGSSSQRSTMMQWCTMSFHRRFIFSEYFKYLFASRLVLHNDLMTHHDLLYHLETCFGTTTCTYCAYFRFDACLPCRVVRIVHPWVFLSLFWFRWADFVHSQSGGMLCLNKVEVPLRLCCCNCLPYNKMIAKTTESQRLLTSLPLETKLSQGPYLDLLKWSMLVIRCSWIHKTSHYYQRCS